jgi:hypothetical protein
METHVLPMKTYDETNVVVLLIAPSYKKKI